MSRAGAALGVGLAVALTLAGCGSGRAGDRRPVAAYPSAPSNADLMRRAGLAPCPPSDSGARAGRLPAVTLPCLGAGPAVQVAGLRGRPTVVNVWGSWCVPCQAEVAYLVAAAAALGNRVRFLGVDTVDDPRSALDFAAHVGMKYPSVRDDNKKVLLALKAIGPPVTAFVRADGSVAHVTYGEYRSTAAVRRDIATYLGVAG